jgi:Asp-tRNA(Asn)/Glu-tRNA(Gln) amidotransferase A subunit family amidase
VSGAAGRPAAAVDDLTRPGALAAFRDRFAAAEERVATFVDEPGRFVRLAAEADLLAARARREELPLAGVPLGVKDVFHVDGLPTRAGSRLPPEELAGPEAEAVRRLRRAGAVVVGKTATTEFAYFAPAPTRNPHHPEHTPGGSSSGSAAAVATGQCVLALGTQTIGSVGRPASFCGVVGLKPSYDRVPRDGLLPLAPSVDHVGVFAPDVAWIARAAAVLCDDWRAGDEGGEGGGRPVLGVPEGPYLAPLTAVGCEHFASVRRRLVAAGFEVRPVPVLEGFAELVRRHRRLVAAEAAKVHAARFERHGALYREATVKLIEEGRTVPSREWEASVEGRGALRRDLEAAMEAAGIDLWLAPAATGTAPLGLGHTGDPVMNLPWTHAGLPAVVVPAGWRADDHGHRLPIGVQLVGHWWRDEALLGWAAVVEEALAAGSGDGEVPS